MRFGFALVMTAIFGTGLAAPLAINQRSLVTEVGTLVGQLISGVVVVDQVETELDHLLGGTLTKIEDKIGVSFATKLLDLSQAGAAPGTVQAIGEAVSMLAQGLPLASVNAYLTTVTGGLVTSLETELGVTDLLQALDISL